MNSVDFDKLELGFCSRVLDGKEKPTAQVVFHGLVNVSLCSFRSMTEGKS